MSTRSELLATARLALPIATGLAGHGLMTTLDAIILGRHSTEALAACALGANLHLPALLAGYGLVAGVSVFTARGRGAGNPAGDPSALRGGLMIAGIGGLTIALALHIAAIAGLTAHAGAAGRSLAELNGFLAALAWSTPFSLLFQTLKNAEEAHERPWRPLGWLLVGLVVNASLALPLVFGLGPIPSMGATGAGLATLAGRAVMLAGLAWQCRHAIRIAYAATNPGTTRALLKFGAPCALHWSAEVGVFSITPVIIARWFGETAVAAHQIALSVATLAFMAPLGISLAGGIRVGEAFGADDHERVRRIGKGALIFSLIFMGLYALGILATHRIIPVWYTGSSAPPETLRIASDMLLVAAAFAMGDGVQVTASGLLRGLGDTRVPSFFGIVAYWGVGLPVGLALARLTPLGPIGLWIGLATGLGLAALVFTARWFKLTRSRR